MGWGDSASNEFSFFFFKLPCSLDMLPSGGSNMSHPCGSTDGWHSA